MSKEYLYEELEAWLLNGITSERWRLGERLPSIRSLCEEHSLSKITVLHALQRLEAKGLLEARPKAGYFVSAKPNTFKKPVARAQIEAPSIVTISDLLVDVMNRSAAFDLLPWLNGDDTPPTILNLNRSIGRALRTQNRNNNQYYDKPAGLIELREQLTVHISRRDLKISPEELCITSGCQHSLFLALLAVCSKGDVVAVESPGFYGVLQLLEQLGLQVVEVPTSIETGMDIDALEEVVTRWKVKACIVSPAYATPGGALMPDSSKKRLVDLAELHDIAIIEDDIYADTSLTYPPSPIKAFDNYNRVILCSSFSKCLSRDLRVGWVSGSRWHKQIIQLKLVSQLASSRFVQQGIANFMADGGLSSHLRRLRQYLRHNRDTLIVELQSWSSDIRISTPQGGLAVWVELPNSVNTLSLYSKGLEEGIVITPGPMFSASGHFPNCLRISFAHPWNTARLNALTKLSKLLLDKT